MECLRVEMQAPLAGSTIIRIILPQRKTRPARPFEAEAGGRESPAKHATTGSRAAGRSLGSGLHPQLEDIETTAK